MIKRKKFRPAKSNASKAKPKPRPKSKSNLKGFLKAVGKGKGKKRLTALAGRKHTHDPHWDLDRDGITYSAISKFLNCRDRFHKRYVQGWTPKGISYPLEFGNLFHLFLEAQEHNIPVENMLKVAMNYATERAENGNLSAEETTDLNRLAAVSWVTFKQYVQFWSEHASAEFGGRWYMEHEFEWIAREQAFDFTYTLPNGRTVKIRGRQDGKFSIGNTPGNWLMENKTKGDIDEDGIKHGLTKDMQTGLYLVAMQHQDRGVCPKGFVYNVIRRTRLKPRVKETAKQFADRVELDIAQRPDFYFKRWSVSIDQQDLDDFKQQVLNPILYQITVWWDSIKKKPLDPWVTTNEDGKSVDNLNHFQRPFGCYDSQLHSQRGEYFEIITQDNYHFFEQAEFTFPELDDTKQHDISRYLKGVVKSR